MRASAIIGRAGGLNYDAFRSHIAGLATNGVWDWSSTYVTATAAYRTTIGTPTQTMRGTPWLGRFHASSTGVQRAIQHCFPSEAAWLSQVAAAREVFFRTLATTTTSFVGVARNGYSSDDAQYGSVQQLAITFTELLYWDGVQAQRVIPNTGSGPSPYSWSLP